MEEGAGAAVSIRHHSEEGEGEDHMMMGLGSADKPGNLRSLLRSPPEEEEGQVAAQLLLQQWDGFVQETLHTILDHQMVGSYSALANLSAMSQVRNCYRYLYAMIRV